MAVKSLRQHHSSIALLFLLLVVAAIAIALIVFSSQNSYAFETTLNPFYRGAESTAMGGASVATVEGVEAVFLNPAGMAANRGVELHYLPATAETSTDTINTASTALTAFHNLDSNSLEQLVGRDIYARAQATPTLLIPNFGVSFMSDQQFAVNSRNLSLPQFVLGYQTTNAVQFSYGVSVLSHNRRDKDPKDDLRIGVGYTMAWRRGGYYDLSMDQILNASEQEFKTLVGSFQSSSSANLGVQYIHKVDDRLKLQWGTAFTQIGNMNFGSGTQTQEGNLSTGVAAKYKFNRVVDGTLEYDLQNLNENIEFQKRNHVGISLGLPLLTLYGGLYETLPTFGVSMDIWILRLTALSYVEEQDAFVGQDEQRRYMVSLDFKFAL